MNTKESEPCKIKKDFDVLHPTAEWMANEGLPMKDEEGLSIGKEALIYRDAYITAKSWANEQKEKEL